MPPDAIPTSSSCDDDLPWVRRAQAGELDAFDTLVARHQNEMTALLHRFAPSRADLEDMVQETFLRAWRALGEWQPEKPFRHWLKRIAVRVGLDFCRKHRRTPFARLAEGDHAERLTSLASPGGLADQAAEEVQFLLSQLPPEDRALLTLLHLNEMPLNEIASHFGWSRANAAIKAFRARRRLKTILSKHGYTLD